MAENPPITSPLIKEWSIKFLQSLNADRETYLQKFRTEYAHVIRESIENSAKASYTPSELYEFLKEAQKNFEKEFNAALVNLSVKGVRHLRVLLEQGENAMDILFEPEEEAVTEKVSEVKVSAPARVEISRHESPVMQEKLMSTALEKIEKLEEKLSQSFSEIEKKLQMLDKQAIDYETQVQNLQSLMVEIRKLSEKLEKEQQKLSSEISAFKEENPKETELNIVQGAFEVATNQYKKLEEQLKKLTEELAEKIEKIEALEIQTPSKERTAPVSIEKVVDEQIPDVTMSPQVSQPTTAEEPPSQPEVSEEVKERLDSETIEEFKQTLEQTIIGIKESLMEPLRAVQQLSRIEEKLEETPAISMQDTSSSEIESLRVTIQKFKEELRRRDLILEHTRKALSSNPKYAALWILQELGELKLSTLSRSVGVAPVVLKKLLREFKESGLINFDEEAADPVIEVIFDFSSTKPTPSMTIPS